MSLALNECLINFMSLLIAFAGMQVSHRTIDHVPAQRCEYLGAREKTAEANCRD